MKGQLDKVLACLKELRIRPKIDDFESKLVVQKTVFLLGMLGVKTGYAFNLYVRGPYSPGLTKDLYANKSKAEKLEANARLSAGDVKRVSFLRQNVEFRPSMLEIVSTFAFLKFVQKLPEGAAVKRLKEIKPFFTEVQYAVGISKAKALFFVPSKEDLEFIRRETELWDAVSAETWAKIP